MSMQKCFQIIINFLIIVENLKKITKSFEYPKKFGKKKTSQHKKEKRKAKEKINVMSNKHSNLRTIYPI
jgi:predicted translin family RNA/ssDNA-binding protein